MRPREVALQPIAAGNQPSRRVVVVIVLVLLWPKKAWRTVWRRPAAAHTLGSLADLIRSKQELVCENALLRHQLVVLERSVKRPVIRPGDRCLMVLLAGRIKAWCQAVLIVQPDTLLRWHREGFRQVWRRKSAPKARKPGIPEETIALICQMRRAVSRISCLRVLNSAPQPAPRVVGNA